MEDDDIKKEIEKEISGYLSKKNHFGSLLLSEKKNINLILLADSQNSLEVLNNVVEKINNSDINFSVVHNSVRKLNNSDLNLAKITNSIILFFGFQFLRSEEK